MWTDILFRLEVWRRKFRRALGRGEFLFARILGLNKDPGAGGNGPGVLLLQIDGLSYRQFERALESNRMPFLKSLLKSEAYRLIPFYSGLPSSTPAVQAELHYGLRCAVPAFGFLDRQYKDFVLMYDPEAAARIEAQLRKSGNDPLLRDGSSWMNVYSGGAALEETHFSSRTYSLRRMLGMRSLLRVVAIICLHLPSALRVLVMSLAELFPALWDMARAVAAGEPLSKELEFIVSRVIVAAALREALQLGGAIDLNRGLPIVHINFLGYDERSHRRGPATRFAVAELRRIDKALSRLSHAAHSSTRRDYQVWIFSDHGQETVRSFEEEYGGGIGRIVQQGLEALHAGRSVRVSSFCGTEWERAWLRRNQIWSNLEDQEKPDVQGSGQSSHFVVVARGPVGHLYLSQSWSVEQKRAFGRWLVDNGKVPGVLCTVEPGKAVWLHPKGQARLPEDAEGFLPHPKPMRSEIARDLISLCEHPNSGSLILLGWSPECEPWTFPLERGAHAGPGIDETQAFALIPADARLPDGARELLRPSALREGILHALGRQSIGSGGRAVEQSPRKLRVMTYNVHSCIGLDGRLSRVRTARIIRSFDPDIVALQELDIDRERSGRENQVERLANDLQMKFEFCTTVCRNRERYGHAVLSRFPMKAIACGLLGGSAAASRKAKPEPRGALLTRIAVGERFLFVLSTHLGLTRGERERQVLELLGPDWLGQIEGGAPIVVCGDFNMLPASKPYKAIASQLLDAKMLCSPNHPVPTFVSAYPFTRIDYIFVNDKVHVESVRAPRTALTTVASDHLPLIAEVGLK